MKKTIFFILLGMLFSISGLLFADEIIVTENVVLYVHDGFTDPIAPFLEGLQLNETQVEYIERYIDDFRDSLNEKLHELLTSTVQRRIAMYERDFDLARTHAAEQNKIRGEISVLRINQFERIFSVLTPEQREYIEVFVNEAFDEDYETRGF